MNWIKIRIAWHVSKLKITSLDYKDFEIEEIACAFIEHLSDEDAESIWVRIDEDFERLEFVPIMELDFNRLFNTGEQLFHPGKERARAFWKELLERGS